MCVYTYIHTRIHTHAHTHICVCIHIYMKVTRTVRGTIGRASGTGVPLEDLMLPGLILSVSAISLALFCLLQMVL